MVVNIYKFRNNFAFNFYIMLHLLRRERDSSFGGIHDQGNRLLSGVKHVTNDYLVTVSIQCLPGLGHQ